MTENLNICLKVKREDEFSLYEIIKNKTFKQKSEKYILNLNITISRKDVQIWNIVHLEIM